MGENGRQGQYSIDKFFPASNITYNVLAGGPASSYPKPNAFPTMDQWNASFPGGDDYRLKTTSVFYGAGAGGTVPGADLGIVGALVTGVVINAPTSTPLTPAPTPPPPNAAPVAPSRGAHSVG